MNNLKNIKKISNRIFKKPQILENLKISEKKPNYEWSSDTALYYLEIENFPLFKKINHLPLNTQYALGLAITEWIFWRFEELEDITDEIERVESAWAGLININYIKSLEYEMKEDDDKEPIKGAIEVAKYFLNDLYLYYKDPEDQKYLASVVVSQLLLARRLMFNKKEFLSWFEEVMERVATISDPKEQILWRNELFMQSCDEVETKTDNEFLNALIKTDNKYINQNVLANISNQEPNKYQKQLEEHALWVKTQDWYDSKKEPYAIFKNPPLLEEINQLKEKFGDLPASYLKTLTEFGLSEFTYDCYTAKMLSPKEIISSYDIIQDEMDFNDGLREDILEEDGVDFYKFIPVMAGKGVDGAWALLDLSEENNGQILYWDTDEAGDIESTFENLEEFILELFERSRTDDPLPLTNNVEPSTYHNSEKETAKTLNQKSIIEATQNQDYQKALEYTQLALEYDSTNVETLYNQAYYLSQLNKLDLAEKGYQQVLEIAPNFQSALFNLSHILLGKNKFEEAKLYNERLLQINPTHYKALVIKGNILFQQKKYKEAIEDAYKILTEIEPEDIAGWQGMGLCYSWLGDNKNAIVCNKKAIEIQPRNYMILANLGSNLNNVGQYEEALLHLNQSIDINDKYYYSYYCKACVFSLTNHLKEAINMIKKVLELEPSQFEHLKNEPDFENIRNSDAFKQIFRKTNK